ncbi:hypothetical protein DL96DRAFT_1594587 [Flagelloscypha sp. PMI_526]|nr:hypothetical protein DL96DRAFT_1594587 [Flagelloscypha sp. PMI_526]
MGATRAQATAALKVHKDVMEAAEKIFDGKFDNAVDDDEAADTDGDVPMASGSGKASRASTPDADSDEDEDADLDDEDDDDFVDYDSDDAMGEVAPTKVDVDPYAGIFFSKDRREVVIEVEEEPEQSTLTLPDGSTQSVKLMTQGQWMKGCPEGSEQSFLFQLYTQLSQEECKCPQDCGASVPRTKSDFFAIFPKFSQYIEHVRATVRKTCAKCSTTFCFACGETIQAEKGKSTKPAADVLFHCANLQGVILGVGMSMIEDTFVEQDEAKSGRSDRTTAQTAATTGEDDEDFVPYPGQPQGKKSARGTGYAGAAREDMSGQQAALAAQLERDSALGSLLREVRVYLPNLQREGGGMGSDYLVHPTSLAHLRRRFNKVGSALLRNDSLADMSERGPPLYFELLEWLETISRHEALASMMAMPIMVVNSVKTVKGNAKVREREITYEGSAGPRELLEQIAIQVRAALRGLEGLKPPEPKAQELTEEQKRMAVDTSVKVKEIAVVPQDEKQKLLSFCKRIISTISAIDQYLRDNKGQEFVDRMHASLPKIITGEDDVVIKTAGLSDAETQKAYVDWANRRKFEYCDLSLPADKQPQISEGDSPHYLFHFNHEARMLVNSDIPKRSLAIAKEVRTNVTGKRSHWINPLQLAILTTNLPVAWDSSVFLRVDESRVDIIKALITGPEGTPYYNGCHCFDIFLGPSYNQSPPSVKYMTTGGGKYRFNPNLYADGKVCLSLLGTWQGPGWVAGRSTLLQVLISIQSMILVPDPYVNEPGWASSGGSPQALAYSANVRRMVVKVAMLEQLKNPPEPFGDIIRTHFKLKAVSLTKQLDEWLALDDGKEVTADYNISGGATSQGFKKDVKELKALLKELQDED